MLKGKVTAKWLVVTIVALLAGFAPIFHSLCIQATQFSSTSHVMSDGTVMYHAPHTDTQPTSGSMTHNQSDTTDPTPVKSPGVPLGGDPLTLVAMFLLPACLALIGFLLATRKLVEQKFSDTIFRLQSARPPTWRHFPNAVNSLAFGISRT